MILLNFPTSSLGSKLQPQRTCRDGGWRREGKALVDPCPPEVELRGSRFASHRFLGHKCASFEGFRQPRLYHQSNPACTPSFEPQILEMAMGSAALLIECHVYSERRVPRVEMLFLRQNQTARYLATLLCSGLSIRLAFHRRTLLNSNFRR